MIVKWVTHNVFNIQPTSNYSSFDPESIMMYVLYALKLFHFNFVV